MRPADSQRVPRGRWAGTAVTAAALLLLAACGGGQPARRGGSAGPDAASAAPAAASLAVPGHRYVSFTSYPGWIQASIPPGRFDYTPWTIINDFGLWPAPRGGIAVGDMQSLAYIPPAVAAAHRAGRLIIMAVGEQGQGADFASAASPAHRARLIRAIVSYVAKYHFDGVDIDWEEQVPANQADYVALVRGVRSALDQAFPGRHLYLSADVNPGQIPPAIAARIAPSVDSLNDMSFTSNGISSINAYLRAGIPASKLLIGIGVAPGYYDSTVARVAAKVTYAERHGLKGTLLWQPGNLHSYRSDPRLVPLRQMVGIRG